ncbi:hypothetical protein QTP86_000857 [Hemibagrus guttatus]|nr:hypothetical protein QTP86_000857 [Hemibagrus guttatus]
MSIKIRSYHHSLTRGNTLSVCALSSLLYFFDQQYPIFHRHTMSKFIKISVLMTFCFNHGAAGESKASGFKVVFFIKCNQKSTRKSTTDAIFALRILMEKYRDGQRELHCVFVDLEKAYDRVPREELWYCMRKSGIAEKYVRVVQDMYERSRTVVRCAVGQTEEFNVEVGLHQGSALSPFLFAIVMGQLSEEVRQESPWTMMFADDIVICSESREQVEENLERWRFALERRGMKVSRSKTEYMCVNEREGSGTVRLQGEEVKKVQEFKYLGSTVQSNGECGKEVKKRVQAVVRPAMLYGLETVSLRKRQESELERRESEYFGRRMLDMELPGRRQRGRPKRRYMDGINEDMKLVGGLKQHLRASLVPEKEVTCANSEPEHETTDPPEPRNFTQIRLLRKRKGETR